MRGDCRSRAISKPALLVEVAFEPAASTSLGCRRALMAGLPSGNSSASIGGGSGGCCCATAVGHVNERMEGVLTTVVVCSSSSPLKALVP
mmetsp:Transcript_10960/g.23494  ORF Transcript_10960/g.23494 Transcript_10960/m.23494 type:complete len:90 (+) Transcript_10960:834-1103(+)